MGENMVFAEHRLILTERIVDGKVRIECEMDGDGVKHARAAPEDPVSTGYLLLVTAFNMFTNGDLFQEMQKQFGVTPERIAIHLEELPLNEERPDA